MASRRRLASAPEQVEVISPFAGGGFGQKNSLQMQTVLAAVAARADGRPVKLVVPRTGVFHDASFRPASRHHVRLGADAVRPDGRRHSRGRRTDVAARSVSRRIHATERRACTASQISADVERLVRTDVQTPGYMRAPFEHRGVLRHGIAASTSWPMRSARIRSRCDSPTTPRSIRFQAAVLVAPCRRMPAPRRRALRLGQAHAWRRNRCEPRTASLRSAGAWRCGAYPGLIVPAIAQLKVTDDGGVSHQRRRPRDGPRHSHCAGRRRQPQARCVARSRSSRRSLATRALRRSTSLPALGARPRPFQRPRMPPTRC